MNRPDKEGKQMLMLVYSTFQLRPQIAILRPPTIDVMAAVKVQIDKIIAANVAAAILTHGDTVLKENKFTILVDDLFLIASAASGFASKPLFENATLKAKVDFTRPQILEINYGDINTFATNIINAVTPVIGSLAGYGAALLDLTHTNTHLADFLLIQNLPQLDINAAETQNSNIHPFVTEAKRLLDEAMDPLVNTLRVSSPDDFKAYYEARPIVHLPHGTTVVEGFLFDSHGHPIFNGEIFFPLQNIRTKTLIDGSYRITHFPHGIATPVASADTFIPQTAAPFQVKQGATVHHTFLLATI